MTARILDGKRIADSLLDELKGRVDARAVDGGALSGAEDLGWMQAGEPPSTPADRCPNRLNDDRRTHGDSLEKLFHDVLAVTVVWQ